MPAKCHAGRSFREVALTLLAGVAHAAALTSSAPYQAIRAVRVINPTDGRPVPALEGLAQPAPRLPAALRRRKQPLSLVVLLPQLGEFDSSEYCEQLVAVLDDLRAAEIRLRVIGIGDAPAARRFSAFTGLPLGCLRADPSGAVHEALGLHAGPCWSWPGFVPAGVLALLLRTLPGGVPPDGELVRPAADAWLNYLAMCAGIGAPGTLIEILRGYLGDRSAPERLAPDAVVTAGPVTIGPGVGPVKLGPLRYSNWWKDEAGYQRPVELATVRLRNMVEVLSNWDEYVSDPTQIARRGATYVFGPAGELLYEYRSRGVLTYAETMSRPLAFLAPYIGSERACNPLGLVDDGGARVATD